MVQLSSDLDSYQIQMKNVTEVNMFILMGFTDDLEVQLYLFLLFLAIYLFTLVGNLGLVMMVIVDSRIQNPMYYFLSVLSFLDAYYSSVVTPKMLINFLSENKTISYLGCAAQMLLFVTFGTTECFLLAAMAYDHYVAIYDPLLYLASMAPRVYVGDSSLLPMLLASCMLLYTQWLLSASPSVPPMKSDTCSVTSLPSSLFLALTLTQTSFYFSILWALLR